MDQFAFAARAMFWTIWRSLLRTGADEVVFAVGIVLLAVATIFAWRRATGSLHWKFLLLLPAIWICIAGWGLRWWLLRQNFGRVQPPLWAFYPASLGFFAVLLLGVAATVLMRRNRLFTGLYALLNFAIALQVAVIADLAVSGGLP